MKQKDFLIWMLGFPLVNSVQELVTEYFIGRTFSIHTHGFAAGVGIIFYIVIGFLLWEKKNNNKKNE